MKAAVFLLINSAYAADQKAEDFGDDSFRRCWSNKDCPNEPGMFNGTCCGRTDFVKGDPFRLGGDWAKTAEMQNKDPSMGMCNAAETLDFGQVPVGGTSGVNVNVGDYLRDFWNKGGRPYFVQTMGNLKLEQAPEDFDKWVSMIQNDYDPARYWFESEFRTNCLEPRMAPVQDNEEFKECRSQNDCMNHGPMFDGGCCLRTEVTEGREFLGGQPVEIRGTFERQEKDQGLGLCAPKWITEYFEQKSERNFWEYESFIFSQKDVREAFFKDWPQDQARPESFNGWAEAVQPYMDVKAWREIFIDGQCLAGDMWDMDMPDFDEMQEMFEDLDMEVDVRDDGMTISMEGMSVEMEQGENGNSMRIVLGAAKIAATAAAVATMTLY